MFKFCKQCRCSINVRNGAISLIGRSGQVTVPHLVHPLTVEPGKPRLCYDARFLNLWIKDSPFKLDRLADVPRYVTRGSYQTVIDDYRESTIFWYSVGRMVVCPQFFAIWMEGFAIYLSHHWVSGL
jgi:hypothetical protein